MLWAAVTIFNDWPCSYPGTVTLNLGRTLSSGHGSVSFSSDGECTKFVHSFFPSCGPHLASCTQVRAAALQPRP